MGLLSLIFALISIVEARITSSRIHKNNWVTSKNPKPCERYGENVKFCFPRWDHCGQPVVRWYGACNLDSKPEKYSSYPPTFFVIGAQKAGTSTTSFHINLYFLPQLGVRKELHFFQDRPYNFRRIWRTPERANAEYKKLFRISKKGAPLDPNLPSFEATPDYLGLPKNFVYNLAWTLGKPPPQLPKMIVLMRNPLTRLYSQFVHMRGEVNYPGTPLATFVREDFHRIFYCDLRSRKNVANFNDCYFNHASHNKEVFWNGQVIYRGLYYVQLRELLDAGVSMNRVMVICLDDYVKDKMPFWTKMMKWVGVDPSHKEVDLPTHFHEPSPEEYRTSHNITLPKTLISHLEILFRKWNRVLKYNFNLDCGWKGLDVYSGGRELDLTEKTISSYANAKYEGAA